MLGPRPRIYTARVSTPPNTDPVRAARHHTLIVVAITVEGSDEIPTALDMARHEVSGGARLVEWRVDALAEEPGALQAVLRLVRESPAPCIVTIRHADEGGAFRGDDGLHGRVADQADGLAGLRSAFGARGCGRGRVSEGLERGGKEGERGDEHG